MEHSHDDEVFDGLLVASRLPPLLCHDSGFLLGVTFHHESSLVDENGYGGGVVGDNLGGIRVGKRKKKAAAAKGNGAR